MTTASKRPTDGVSRDGEAPVRVDHRTFAGVRTRVLTVGPAASQRARTGKVRRKRALPPRPRFVLFHGYCDSADTWTALLHQLAAEGHSAVAIDLPGFGDADELRDGPILPQLDAFVSAVVKDQAAHGEVVLVGNSLGGTVSLRAAQNRWLPIAGVTSIAAPGFSDTWLVRTIRKYPLPLRVYASLPLPVPGKVIRTVADNVIPRLLSATPRPSDDEHVRRFLSLFPDYRSTASRLRQARRLVEELDDCYELDRITAPLLVVACGRDRLVRAAGGTMLHTLVPHSRLLVREDWGHCPQLDHAEEVNQLVSYFGESCARTTPHAEVPATKPDAAAS
ncbi:alpha/beta fold hydrolase [Haloechinothrix halophila]|uniref:alpha/beta fold hydrolase n=1 Tax=Haloechinothrix halophila TaxID=1069073 RepID=UPI00041436B0|nr:alpha/beta fold hydrolase [Haloechinothrix halophila]